MPSYVFLRPARETKFTVNKSLEAYCDVEYVGLDATASLRKYWRKRSARGYVFIDIRTNVKPDIRCSNEALPFRSGVFEQVFYDPPSVARGRGQFTGSSMAFRYGWWPRKRDFDRNLTAVNAEFARVLSGDGAVLFKWTEGPGAIRPIAHCLAKLDNFRPVHVEKRPSKSGNKRTTVYFITMAKRREAA
jgi:hypothetical protein